MSGVPCVTVLEEVDAAFDCLVPQCVRNEKMGVIHLAAKDLQLASELLFHAVERNH